ncbi:predicted protein [Staphylococcus aureus subsp. aureus EMRSA16]|nr:predicted protein [Staphylococcus aureus subsp. aureus EMRSA16]
MNSIIFNTSKLHIEISFDVFLYFKTGKRYVAIFIISKKNFLEIQIYNTRFIENILILL